MAQVIFNILLVIFGTLPSIAWLLFYLKKDPHPESKKVILRVFLWGALITFPVIFWELGFINFLSKLNLPYRLFTFLEIFIGTALIEELLKFWVIKKKVLNNSEFDEPVDAVIYMITAGLGFAAIENIFLLFFGSYFLLHELFVVIFIRFLTATFLHALTSGILGYFLALAIFETKRRKQILAGGLVTVVLLHGFYNFVITKVEGFYLIFFLALILITTATFLFLAFKKLKKMKSICKI